MNGTCHLCRSTCNAASGWRRPLARSPGNSSWQGVAYQDVDAGASIRIRGSSSARENQKKSYNLKLRDDSNNARLQVRLFCFLRMHALAPS